MAASSRSSPSGASSFVGNIHGEVDATTTVTFDDENGKTRLTVEQVYSRESDETRGASVGWGQTLDHLAAFVARG
jgi:uncharacterized protein YndB with AHSA1/START domain